MKNETKRPTPSHQRDHPVPVSTLLWTDAFEPPWGAGDRVLIAAVGSRGIIESTVERLVEGWHATVEMTGCVDHVIPLSMTSKKAEECAPH